MSGKKRKVPDVTATHDHLHLRFVSVGLVCSAAALRVYANKSQNNLLSPLLPYAPHNLSCIPQQVGMLTLDVSACVCTRARVCRVRCMCMSRYVCMSESLSFPLCSTSKGINPSATDAGVCILSVGSTSGMNRGWKDRLAAKPFIYLFNKGMSVSWQDTCMFHVICCHWQLLQVLFFLTIAALLPFLNRRSQRT